MIVRSEDVKLQTTDLAEGVAFKALATGKEMMVTIMYYEEDAVVKPHCHHNEQAGFVVEGKLKMRIGNEENIIEKGDSYIVKADEVHSMIALKKSEVVDTFSPPREDYRERSMCKI